MTDRRVLLYFAWSRPAEAGKPLEIIEDRFPAIFELRRLFYPRFERLAGPVQFDQGVRGFLDHVQMPNFAAFAGQSAALTGQPVQQIERMMDDGSLNALDETLLADVDTAIVIGFDSAGTAQTPGPAEIDAVRDFLGRPGTVLFLCPHHQIGDGPDLSGEDLIARQTAEYLHHGDHAIPPRQSFGGYVRALLAGLGVPVENRHGLRPAVMADGAPAPIAVETARDRLGLLCGVAALNLHPHLPHLERTGDSMTKLEVLARQPIDMTAPPHPFTATGRDSFDALLQSAPDIFDGTLLVGDTTLFSATAGGLDNLRRMWANLVQRR